MHLITLKKLCYDGMENKGIDEEDRLTYELDVIKNMGYVDYFLITWDFIRYARENNIIVGPGRGSAAGSLVSYTLGITNINPIKYNLIFERFLNPERITMPDIDIDFCYERRQEVIDYVIRKYGSDRVAQIITFGTMAARAVIRDVGRAMNVPYGDVDIIAKMIPFQIGMTIKKALEINSDLKARYTEDETVKELIDTALQLEGMPRHASTHAAGVVITKDPVTEYVPLQKNDECITTQFTMNTLEELGLLKMDFLGLRTLTVIRDTIDMVYDNFNKKIDIDNIGLDDKNVYMMIANGNTTGVFQLESAGMTSFMKDLKPGSLEDIIAGISLFRPGPMDSIPRYIKNKNSQEDVSYPHPKLKEILSVTYGCMVYQEQVMQIVREIGGYSLGRADLVRRAMSKKKMDVMQKERLHFTEGALGNGVSKEIADKLFDEMIDFASYAFNKSHAAAYAVIAYQTGWLKYYYPTEFMAAMLNSYIGSSSRVSRYIDDCKSMKIDVLPPDINESNVRFSVINKKIRFGLCAIKNVGSGIIKDVTDERKENGNYRSFIDFCERTSKLDINKRCVESLIKAGSFDSMNKNRAQLMAVFEKIIDGINNTRKRNVEGQVSMFEMNSAGKEQSGLADYKFPDIKDYPQKMMLAMEKEMLGLYISGHPLDNFKDEILEKTTVSSMDLYTDEENENSKKINDGMNVTVGGIVTNRTIKTTKNNKTMAFIEIGDFGGTMEIVVFPEIYERNKMILIEDNIIYIKGSINMKEEEQAKIIANTIYPVKKEIRKTLCIKIDEELEEERFLSLKALLNYFSGNSKCIIAVDKNGRTMKNDSYYVDINDNLLNELIFKFGKENIKLIDNA
jgi:DNA polymerase-3 subunit alpha